MAENDSPKNGAALPGVSYFIKIIFFGIFSWVLLHFFALLGPFIALSLPIWWLFFPRKIPCIGCQFRSEGEFCPFCGREVQRDAPRRFRSVLIHMVLLFLLFLISLGTVYGERELLKELGITLIRRTATFEIPPRGQFRLGEVFPMKITISGIRRPINAIQADFSFDPQRLELMEFSTSESFATVFVQKEINNDQGFGRITGGVPNPGFFSERGTLATAYFRGKIPGLAEVKFLPSSMILANDGHGSNVLGKLGSSHYLILPETLSETEFEIQESVLLPEILEAREEQEEKMIFFEESGVLGEKLGELEYGAPRRGFFAQKLLVVLNSFNSAVINFWERVYSFLFITT